MVLAIAYFVWAISPTNSPVFDDRPKSLIKKRKINLKFFSPIWRIIMIISVYLAHKTGGEQQYINS